MPDRELSVEESLWNRNNLTNLDQNSLVRLIAKVAAGVFDRYVAIGITKPDDERLDLHLRIPSTVTMSELIESSLRMREFGTFFDEHIKPFFVKQGFSTPHMYYFDANDSQRWKRSKSRTFSGMIETLSKGEKSQFLGVVAAQRPKRQSVRTIPDLI